MKTLAQILKQIKHMGYTQEDVVIFAYLNSNGHKLYGYGTPSSPIGRWVLEGEDDSDVNYSKWYPNPEIVSQKECAV